MKKTLLASIIMAAATTASADVNNNINIGGYINDLKMASNSIQKQFQAQGAYTSLDTSAVLISGEFPQGLSSNWGTELSTPWEGGSLLVLPFTMENPDDLFGFELNGIPQEACNTLAAKLPEKGFTIMESACDAPEANSMTFIPSCGTECTPKYTNYNTRSTIRDLNQVIKAIKRHYKGDYTDLNGSQLANIKGVPASWIPNGEQRMSTSISSASTFELDDAFELTLDLLSQNMCGDISYNNLLSEEELFSGDPEALTGVIEVISNGSTSLNVSDVSYNCYEGMENTVTLIVK